MAINSTSESAAITCRSFESPLGPMIAGAIDEGICLLEWHDRGGVVRILQRAEKRHGLATIESDHRWIDQLKGELSEYFDGKRSEFSVPVAPQGTRFEMRVWSLLLAIPYGRQRTYGNIARDLGKPGASRAVGR
ncbi:hypothetical protein GF377_00785, partial [candidate division GN15 bacterium]|nr:hypothetical protein [candidate division GN15 bacterium]